MKLQLFAYWDEISAPPAIKMTGETGTSYAGLQVILWHVNFGVFIAKMYQCQECGDLVPAACRCPRCWERR